MARWSRSKLDRRDKQLKDALKTAGVDFARPRHVIHNIWFQREDDAVLAAEQAATSGWSSRLGSPAAHGEPWMLSCDKHFHIIDDEEIVHLRQFFETVAGVFRGEYDGWQASTTVCHPEGNTEGASTPLGTACDAKH